MEGQIGRGGQDAVEAVETPVGLSRPPVGRWPEPPGRNTKNFWMKEDRPTRAEPAAPSVLAVGTVASGHGQCGAAQAAQAVFGHPHWRLRAGCLPRRAPIWPGVMLLVDRTGSGGAAKHVLAVLPGPACPGASIHTASAGRGLGPAGPVPRTRTPFANQLLGPGWALAASVAQPRAARGQVEQLARPPPWAAGGRHWRGRAG